MKKFFCFLLVISLVQQTYAQTTVPDPSQKRVKFFFPGDKMKPDKKFSFIANFTEVIITTKDHVKLSSALFKADSAKGVILYLA